MNTQPKKILFFAQDGVGLGHLRRLCRVAEYLQGPYSTLVVTGKRETAWMLAPKCEFVHLPSWQSFGMGALATRDARVQVDQKTAVVMVKRLCESVAQAFAPDCIIVDYTLGGMYGELHELLVKSRAKKYMLMRAVLDDEDAKMFDSQPREITEAFDAVLVASDARTSDFGKNPMRIRSFADRIEHVGYIVPPEVDCAATRARYNVGIDQSWVVCSAGGGTNAEVFLQHCVETAAKFPNVFFDIVLGPYSKRSIEEYSKRNYRVWPQSADLPGMHASCDVAVINGGYNSLLESITGGARIIVYPNQLKKQSEQVLHAGRLAQYYPITLLEKQDDLEKVLRRQIDILRLKSRPSFELAIKGRERIKEIIDEALMQPYA